MLEDDIDLQKVVILQPQKTPRSKKYISAHNNFFLVVQLGGQSAITASAKSETLTVANPTLRFFTPLPCFEKLFFCSPKKYFTLVLLNCWGGYYKEKTCVYLRFAFKRCHFVKHNFDIAIQNLFYVGLNINVGHSCIDCSLDK